MSCISYDCPLRDKCAKPKSKGIAMEFGFKIVGINNNHVVCDGYTKKN